MQIPKITARKGLVAGVGALAVVAAGGTAYAATGSSGGSGTPGPAAAAQPASGRAHARSLLRRADHATVELKVKGQWVTYTLDRGTVTAVSPTSITLARPDGQSVTDTLTPQTRYRGVTSETAIQTGRPALVISDAGSALRVRQAPADGESAPAA